MAELIKSILDQWKLVGESLKKAPDDPVTPPAAPTPTPAAPSMDNLKKANAAHISGLFSQLNSHSLHNRNDEAKRVKGEIKDFALGAPKGSIDIGHLGELRENHLKIQHPPGGRGDWDRGYKVRPMTDEDMAEVINHHLGDAKSLKDIYQNHGGEKTLRSLMHVNGARGTPQASYSHIKFKNPSMHADLQDLVNPGVGSHHREENRHKGVLPQAPFAKTEWDPELHQKVHDTFTNMTDDLYEGNENENAQKNHQNAVVDRGAEMFKRHYKLT